MQMEFEHVIFSKDQGVGIITLNRPEARNAISPRMRDSLDFIYRDIRGDPDVRAVVLTGAGSGFCAGADVRGLARRIEDAQSGQAVWTRPGFELSPYVLGLRNLDQPVVAAVNGPCAGIGFSLAMAADVRFAADNAFFMAAWILRGFVPDGGGNYFLPKLVGTSNAFDLIWSGRRVPAREAERLGIVSQVLPPDELMPFAVEYARKLAQMPSVAIALSKRAVYKSLDESLASVMEFEAYAQRICRRTEDHAEGVRAFWEKREPVFKGR